MEISLRPIEDQVIVITGASSGIGLATARAAARRGACVVLAARSDETLSDVVEAIEAEGGSAIAVTTDVSDRAQMEALAEAAIGRFGRIDTWVNNAGVAIYGRLDQVSDADNRKLFDTNFWGVVYGSQVALPHLKKNGGALINVGSEVSDAVAPLQGMYSASKHAVKGFTDALRVEIELVDDANVSITLIQPTAVNTPYPEHARNYMAQEPALPDGQIEPGKVADAILDAATQHRRDVKVGGSAKRNTLASNLIPGAADAMTAKLVHKQQRNETPREPQGTLDQPGFSGREHGRGRENTRAADRADIVDELRSLAQLDIDATFAYSQAIDGCDPADLGVRTQLALFRVDHERHIQELSNCLAAFGEKAPERSRDFTGFLLEGMTAIRALLGTLQALKAMRQNELTTNREYQGALDYAGYPSDVRAMLQRGLADERRHLQYIEDQIATFEEHNRAAHP